MYKKCPKCKKEIKNNDKNIVDITLYSRIDIDEDDGRGIGGNNTKQVLYHQKCFPKNLLSHN